LKQDRYDEKRSAGYQSKILENIIDNEHENANVQKYSVEIEKGSTFCQTSLNDHHSSPSSYIYGAASKGIIKREQQNNSSAYKTLQSSPNPFQQMDKDDVDGYRKTFAQKQLREQGQKLI
jgi:hypothetical protein